MYKNLSSVIFKNHAVTFTTATIKGAVCSFIDYPLKRGKHQ